MSSCTCTESDTRTQVNRSHHKETNQRASLSFLLLKVLATQQMLIMRKFNLISHVENAHSNH
jgi:hypothetical protein